MSQQGTESSFKALLAAAKEMSDKQLKALENDLDFYSETGLVGVQMSGLLSLMPLGPRVAQEAA